MTGSAIIGLAGSLVALAACERPVPDPCAGADSVLTMSSFVLVTTPSAGRRVHSPFPVAGCSRTFESNVVWELTGRDGRVLASGFAAGGGVDGASAFDFAVPFDVAVAEVGRLAVYEPDVSDGEGYPPPRMVLPLVLAPRE